MDGPPEVRDDDFVDGEAGLVDFGLGFEIGVSGEFAEALGAAEEDVGRRCFGEEEEETDEDGGGEPDDFPERPVPVRGGDAEARDDGAEGWAGRGEGCPEGEVVGHGEEGEHVADRGAAGGEAGRAEEALEEAKGDQAREVVDDGGADGDDQEDAECYHVWRVATNGGYFRHWCEEKRSYPIPENVHGETHGGFLWCDTEGFFDIGLRGGDHGAANVDCERVYVDLQHDQDLLVVSPVLRVLWVIGGVPIN